jgi:hypothetical protein
MPRPERCGRYRFLPHWWAGCKCRLCGSTRHQWEGCKCVRCRTNKDHAWSGCTCRDCGQKRNEGHHWVSCVCDRYGRSATVSDHCHDWRGDAVCRNCGSVSPQNVGVKPKIEARGAIRLRNLEDFWSNLPEYNGRTLQPWIGADCNNRVLAVDDGRGRIMVLPLSAPDKGGILDTQIGLNPGQTLISFGALSPNGTQLLYATSKISRSAPSNSRTPGNYQVTVWDTASLKQLETKPKQRSSNADVFG